MIARSEPAPAGGTTASLPELIALRSRVPGGAWHPAPVAAASPGSHPARGRSQGMEFAAARPYQPGDDVRTVDWRQSARRGRLYTKLFQEEHERPVCLLADLGPSMRFGTRVAFKSVQAARVAACLAWLAAAAGDRVGGVVWDGQAHRDVRPRGRQHGPLAFLGALAEGTARPPAAESGGLGAPLNAIAHGLRPGSRVVLISDFAELDAGIEARIAALARRAELVLVHVYDIFEAEAPPPGCYRLTDGRRELAADLRSPAARAAWEAAFAARRARLQGLASRLGAPLLPLPTDADPAGPARALLRRPAGVPLP